MRDRQGSQACITRCRPPYFDPVPTVESPFCCNLGIATFGAFAAGRLLGELGRCKACREAACERRLEDRGVGSDSCGWSIEFKATPSDARLVEDTRRGGPSESFRDSWSDMATIQESIKHAGPKLDSD